MRVNERAPSQPSAAVPRRAGFQDAMRRACEGDAAKRPRAARLEARQAAVRRQLEAQGCGRSGELEAHAARAGAEAPPSAASSDIGPPAEIAAVARTVPVAVLASPPGEGAPLTLTFGRSLEVDLRSAGRGVEIVLRPDARLERAAEADLPHLVRVLRARGVAVASAEVRPRGQRRAR